ncbi:hypothetical protein L3Y34_016243 [Caenorhabditis briggsae]|uniref:Uncharacterized protein n=1 Tax=Caenorhabditis briggsae TaxID=6238 RepID=A0AAE9DVT1_CAEBR|nr:hypothetical protein L3Y34_016243 [Caenorhabditis briggsae]
MTRPQQPRIDLNHGYMRFIRRNQLDRDEFDRVHEQRKSEIRERISEAQRAAETAKRPNVYVPPHLRRQRAAAELEQAVMNPRSTPSRSDSSDSSTHSDDHPEDVAVVDCPIRKKQKDADDHVRRQVRKRIERTLQEEEDDVGGGGDEHEDLFVLELTLKNGEPKTIGVPRNTKAARLAKSISRENNFDDSQCRNLRLFIEEQLELRMASLRRRRKSPEASLPTSPTTSTASESSTTPWPGLGVPATPSVTIPVLPPSAEVAQAVPQDPHPRDPNHRPQPQNQQNPAQDPAAPPARRGYAHDNSVVTPMTMVKTLVALATERMLLKTSGPTFLRGIEFMYAAGLAPDRLSVMMTSSHKYVLQFHSKCDIRPFAANYPNFGRVLRGIVHVREWRIKSIEFVNVAFYMRDVDNLERAIEKLGVELVLLRNCTYPGVNRGDEAVKFLSALNRKKQAVVCEYGDDRLKHRIGRRASGGHRTRRASRNGAGAGQEVVPPDAANPPPAIPEGPGPAAAAPIIAPLQARVQIQEVRRPIPLNQEQARRIMNQQLIPLEQVAAVAPGVVGNDEPQIRPGPQPSNGRVVVGAHVYEFRAIDVPPNGDQPQVHNVNHLLNVLQDNSANDVRVIVLPSRQGQPGGNPINLNNNDNNGMPAVPADASFQHYVAPIRAQIPVLHMPPQPAQRGVPMQQAHIHYEAPAQLMGARGQFHFNAHRNELVNREPLHHHIAHIPLGPSVPMFGDAVNEPLVQRNGDDSNDSTDREEMADDAEQRRNEVLRDLVADPEAQPNFAPVEAEAVDLDMLEEEAEGEEDEVMEGVIVNGQQFVIENQQQPVIQ